MKDFNRFMNFWPGIAGTETNNNTPTQVATAVKSNSQEGSGCKNTTQNILDFEVDFTSVQPSQASAS
ncbi:hypothetical protein [Nonlabens agnitus]|uniref:Uncharacterized protein n=1 Tax=Nonlabens agnitus TaxID=870484 RepID=A0A2S9WXD7_9FLAO|nr:hypothetical protein [Nonlabens agnitus]PRP68134.1 hypothetical protein BST86_14065 [Nonlabens agnitus]